MRILLLTTADSNPARFALCERLIASIAAQLSPMFEVRHHVLVQNVHDTEIGRELAKTHPWLVLHRTGQQVSLSRARNILLERTNHSGDLARADIVGFPDDDAWYPAPFLQELSGLFGAPVQPDIFVCRYSSVPEVAEGVCTRAKKTSLLQYIRCASSNTMFIRADIIRRLGPFDEALGLGTAVPGAEDLDYALRARLIGRRVYSIGSAVVGHRDKSVALRAKYYAADVLVLMRHATNDAAHAALLGRKLMVGLYLMGIGHLSIAAWFHALRKALQTRNKPWPTVGGLF